MKQLLSCKNLKKQTGIFQLSDISFELDSGCIMGVIGRNGSGKTTLLRTLMGSYRLVNDMDCGDVLINDVSVTGDVKLYKEQIAFVLNDTPFKFLASSEDTGRLYGRYYNTFDFDKYMQLLTKFDVPPEKFIGHLSKGEQIKQQLAFALSYEAMVYFFDEPTGNLDVEFRNEFYGYIRKIVSTGTKSVVYASHLVEEMEEFADYILWLYQTEDIDRKTDETAEKVGRIKYFGSIDDMKEKYRIVEADASVVCRIPEHIIIGGKKKENHQELLIRFEADICPEEVLSACRYADLKEIMYYTDKGVIV